MRTWLWAINIVVLVAGCHSGMTYKMTDTFPVTDKKYLSEMAGTWQATEDTYTMLANKNYRRDSIYIILQPDSAFKARLPDCMDAASKGGLAWDAIGAWKLHKDGEVYKLSMAFEKGRLFRFRTFTDFDIMLKDSVLTLSRYVGNPDKEEVLQFRKSHEK